MNKELLIIGGAHAGKMVSIDDYIQRYELHELDADKEPLSTTFDGNECQIIKTKVHTYLRFRMCGVEFLVSEELDHEGVVNELLRNYKPEVER